MKALQRHRPSGVLGRLWRFFATQHWLWERHLTAMRPWEDSELHWWHNPITGRWELRGETLPSAEL